MGLTSQSTGSGTLKNTFTVQKKTSGEFIIALAGNPNTGKSTVFNSLTGLNQHTGNWTGKTVTTAQGRYSYKGKNFIMVDLPGTYSLMSNSVEEEVARDFICFGDPDTTVIVTDATCLERNLILVIQILEMTDKAVVCVNLMDEAKKKSITIDLSKLSELLGVPVVGTSARSGDGLDALMEAVCKVSSGQIETNPVKIHYDKPIEETLERIGASLNKVLSFNRLNSRWISLKMIDNDPVIISSISKYVCQSGHESLTALIPTSTIFSLIQGDNHTIRDSIVSSIVELAESISSQVVTRKKKVHNEIDRKIDNILTSRKFGIPTMVALLGIVFWITIVGANFPSGVLANFLFGIEDKLTALFLAYKMPEWLHGALILGIYRTLAWVVSVMLPPMAIFFPLFTLLEDIGYLPRVAFNLDNFFKKACAHGKQSLTMCMGFGCNAAGVIGCRIIDSPRERLIAILTNNFVPCNGRFPMLITISTIFIARAGLRHYETGGTQAISHKGELVSSPLLQGVIGTLTMTSIIILGVFMTLLVSRILSKTILKGLPSSFTLELPPYRRPQIGKVLVRSVLDRTLFVLGRAVVVAAPAGLVIWIMANINIDGISLLNHSAGFLDPFAALLGLDGYILMAFILGLPANEIVMPIILMSYMATGTILDMESLEALGALLVKNGWTWLTAVNVMLLSLMHFPCATTLLTIKKETGSWKWTLAAFLIPTGTGLLIIFTVTQIVRLLS
jgi:ferrous iron transport protein B